MYKIPARTEIIGKKLVFVPECHSTNLLVAQKVGLGQMVHGQVVIAHYQSAGKGQRGSVWEAQPGKNLTFSIFLKTNSLPLQKAFYLNIISALAIVDMLKEFLNIQAQVKWPNDILVKEKKLGGILVENTIQGKRFSHSIVGIGLNINQEQFQFPEAISLHLMNPLKIYDLETLLHELLYFFEKRYQQLQRDQFPGLKKDYLDNLMGFLQQKKYMEEGRKFLGTIIDLTEDGKIVVEEEGGTKTYSNKEIAWEST